MYHRRQRLAAPYITEKHYTQHAQFNLAAGAITSINLVDAVTVADKNASQEVVEGNTVKAIYLEFWFSVNGTGLGSGIAVLEKTVASQTAMTATESNNLGAYKNKKNVLHTFEGLLPPNTQNPVPIIKGWFRIPKGKQRFGLNDKLVINFSALIGGMTICGFSTYKEVK